MRREGSNGAGRHLRCECVFADGARAGVLPYGAHDHTTIIWALLAVLDDMLVTRVAPFHPVSNAVLHTHAPSTAPDRAGACAARAQTGRGVTLDASAFPQMVHGPVFLFRDGIPKF